MVTGKVNCHRHQISANLVSVNPVRSTVLFVIFSSSSHSSFGETLLPIHISSLMTTSPGLTAVPIAVVAKNIFEITEVLGASSEDFNAKQ